MNNIDLKRSLSVRDRLLIIARDKSTCILCGKNVIDDNIKIHVDHIFPHSLGGQTVFENLACMCNECNQGKSNLVIDDVVIKLQEEVRKRNSNINLTKLKKDLIRVKKKKAKDLTLEFSANKQIKQLQLESEKERNQESIDEEEQLRKINFLSRAVLKEKLKSIYEKSTPINTVGTITDEAIFYNRYNNTANISHTTAINGELVEVEIIYADEPESSLLRNMPMLCFNRNRLAFISNEEEKSFYNHFWLYKDVKKPISSIMSRGNFEVLRELLGDQLKEKTVEEYYGYKYETVDFIIPEKHECAGDVIDDYIRMGLTFGVSTVKRREIVIIDEEKYKAYLKEKELDSNEIMRARSVAWQTERVIKKSKEDKSYNYQTACLQVIRIKQDAYAI